MAIADLAYQHALDRLAAEGFEALPERDRDLVAVWQVDARAAVVKALGTHELATFNELEERYLEYPLDVDNLVGHSMAAAG